MKKQDIIDIVINNSLKTPLTPPPAVLFFTSGACVFTNTVPSLNDFQDNYVVLHNIEYRISSSLTQRPPVAVLEYDKIIGVARY
jgi:hypothetical protein